MLEKIKNKPVLYGIIIAVILFVVVLLGTLLFNSSNNSEHVIFEGKSRKIKLKGERKETYYVGTSTTIADTHPYSHNDEAGLVMMKLVYEPLININNDSKVSYCNAKSIVLKKEGRQATVKINTKKKFSNGTKLTAEYVAKAYKWHMSNESSYSKYLGNVTDVRAVDENTLVFTFGKSDISNIKAFNIPIMLFDEENSDYSYGTGKYCTKTINAYDKIVLEENHKYSGGVKYDKVVIKAVDYNNLENILKKGEYDMFLINREEHGDMVKKSKAYDIYQFGKESGWYLKLTLDSLEQRNALAKTVKDSDAFEETISAGVLSRGIVSAYINKGYFSKIDKGDFGKLTEISVAHDYSGESAGVYNALNTALKSKKIECKDSTMDLESVPDEISEDVLVFYGDYTQVMNKTDNQRIFNEKEEMDVKDFYTNVEKYFAKENYIVPVSKDTVWVAFLAGRNNLGLAE